jgi:hypothetical protein
VNRRRAIVALGSLGAGAVGVSLTLALAGCPNTASTSIYTPPTGIQIDSQDLVAGVGCGPGPGQVYRYAAVVTQETDAGAPFVVSGVFNCYSDALFTNLPSPDGGSTTYSIGIFAYDSASFPAALGGCEYSPLSAGCPGDDAAVVKRYESQATWTTTCTATQFQGVPQVAQCGQLVPAAVGAGDGGDAGETADATGGGDAADAAADAAHASDATEAATAEASDGPGVSGEGGDAPLE